MREGASFSLRQKSLKIYFFSTFGVKVSFNIILEGIRNKMLKIHYYQFLTFCQTIKTIWYKLLVYILLMDYYISILEPVSLPQVLLLTYELLIPQIFIESLLYAKYSTRCWECKDKMWLLISRSLQSSGGNN